MRKTPANKRRLLIDDFALIFRINLKPQARTGGQCKISQLFCLYWNNLKLISPTGHH